MNILMIGNGFDIAHKLPTRYSDFMCFCYIVNAKAYTSIPSRIAKYMEVYKKIYDIIKKKSLEDTVEGNRIKEYCNDISVRTKDNLWIKMFILSAVSRGDQWIDIEKEIASVLDVVDRLIETYNISDKNWDQVLSVVERRIYKCFENVIPGKAEQGYNQWINIAKILRKDYDGLVAALEKYILLVGRVFQVHPVLNGIKGLNIDKVISFNYTDTFERVYDSNIEICYIHGKVSCERKNSNIVLGIDDEHEKRETIIEYKKFYQRVLRECDNIYVKWADEIKTEDLYNGVYIDAIQDDVGEIHKINGSYNSDDMENLVQIKRQAIAEMKKTLGHHNLYIYGHSLDVSDKRVLREFILNDNICTTIYYYDGDPEAKAHVMRNLAIVIGQDEFIKRTTREYANIKFVPAESLQ